MWRADSDSEDPPSSLRYSPVVYQDRVVFSSRSGWILAANAVTGQRLWAVQLDSPINTELVRINDVVYIASEGGALYGMKMDTGQIAFVLELGGSAYGISLPEASRLFTLVEDIGIVCVDTKAKRVLWQQASKSGWTSFKPKVNDGLIWVGNKDGELHGFDIDTGEAQKRYLVDGVIRGFAFHERRLWIGTLGGTLYACDPGENTNN
jgi:outer membrane protein assembly factor BamB